MSNGGKKELTLEGEPSIILTDNEKRIITNLRTQAERNPHSKLAVLFQVHNGLVQHGTLCLGVAPHCSTIRL